MAWPVVTDDLGDKISGTIFNKALTDAIKAHYDALLVSVANPLVDANDVIDEVVNARTWLGPAITYATLRARLDAIQDVTLTMPQLLARQTVNLSSSTVLANSSWSYAMPADTLSATGHFLQVTGGGTMANNANAKSLRIYVGTNFATPIVDNVAIANNKFQFDVRLVRNSAAEVAMDGWVTFHADNGAVPTFWHWEILLAGGATDLTAIQDVKVEMVTPTANADMVLARTSIRLWRM